jgi:hypothetical protein
MVKQFHALFQRSAQSRAVVLNCCPALLGFELRGGTTKDRRIAMLENVLARS